MQRLFFHGYNPNMIFSDQLQAAELRYAVTVHPLKDPRLMFRLHNYYLNLDRIFTNMDFEELNRTMSKLSRFLDARQAKKVRHFNMAAHAVSKKTDVDLGRLWSEQRNSLLNRSFFDQFNPWDLHIATNAEPRTYLGGSYRSSLKIVLGRYLHRLNAKQGRLSVRFVRLLEGWRRYNPLVGYEIVCDSQLQKLQHDRLSGPREGRLRFWSTLVSPVLSKERIPDSRRQVTVNIVLPVSSNGDDLREFLENFEREVLKTNEAATLIVVVFTKTTSGRPVARSTFTVEEELERFMKQHPAALVAVLQADRSRRLSLQMTLAIASKHLREKNAKEEHLIFLADVKVTFRRPFFARCRLNAKAKNIIFFPFPFGLHHREFSRYSSTRNDQTPPIDDNNGQWLPEVSTLVCLHTIDLDVVQLNDSSLDAIDWVVDEADNFVEKLVAIGFNVMRSPDPDLFHKHRTVHVCDEITRNMTARHQCQIMIRDRMARAGQLFRKLYKNDRSVVDSPALPEIVKKWPKQPA